jgi:hypothetical protein
MRPPVDTIYPPPSPKKASWVNAAMVRMDQQREHPVLVEFFDFTLVSSLRTLPYLQAWRERYADAGLRVIGIHTGRTPLAQDEDIARAGVERLGVTYPVLLDSEFEMWNAYDNEGWPARYVWGPVGGGHLLREFHYGEGGYAETERAIQAELGVERDLVAPIHPEDAPDARVVVPTAPQAGAWSGPYEAGGVWAVLSGQGTVVANGTEIAVDHVGAYPLVQHPHHTTGVLDLVVSDGVVCHEVTFTPGVVAP